MLPQGMTIEDASKEYQDNKIVITGNEGVLKIEGAECISCHETHPEKEIKYCPCDESWICSKCCSHCGYSEDSSCTW